MHPITLIIFPILFLTLLLSLFASLLLLLLLPPCVLLVFWCLCFWMLYWTTPFWICLPLLDRCILALTLTCLTIWKSRNLFKINIGMVHHFCSLSAPGFTSSCHLHKESEHTFMYTLIKDVLQMWQIFPQCILCVFKPEPEDYKTSCTRACWLWRGCSSDSAHPGCVSVSRRMYSRATEIHYGGHQHHRVKRLHWTIITSACYVKE